MIMKSELAEWLKLPRVFQNPFQNPCPVELSRCNQNSTCLNWLALAKYGWKGNGNPT